LLLHLLLLLLLLHGLLWLDLGWPTKLLLRLLLLRMLNCCLVLLQHNRRTAACVATGALTKGRSGW
jgi:hypothetical protein